MPIEGYTRNADGPDSWPLPWPAQHSIRNIHRCSSGRLSAVLSWCSLLQLSSAMRRCVYQAKSAHVSAQLSAQRLAQFLAQFLAQLSVVARLC